MGIIINGVQIAEDIKKELKKKTTLFRIMPKLDILYVGEDDTSESFLSRKKKFGEDIGVKVLVHKLPEKSSFIDINKKIDDIKDRSDGIVIQLPLPKHIDAQGVLNYVPVEKDPDVLSVYSIDSYKNNDLKIIPPVAGAIEEICIRNNISLDDKNITIVGCGRLVGRPVQMWLRKQGIDTNIIDENTKNSDSLLVNADIVISGVGNPYLIKPESLKKGVIIFDAGTSIKDGKIAGDFDPLSYEKAFLSTPVPGGIGPITVAVLFRNFVALLDLVLNQDRR